MHRENFFLALQLRDLLLPLLMARLGIAERCRPQCSQEFCLLRLSIG
jgi:hypothetical protein